MNTERNHIDQLLKDKFSSFEADIPMSDWLAIEEKLDRKKRFAWIGWAAIPLLIIAGLGFYSLFFNKPTETFTKSTTAQKPKTNKEIIIEKNIPKEKIISKLKETKKDKERTNDNQLSYKTRKVLENKITENTVTPFFVFESIDVSSKPISELWVNTLPIVEKLKDLEAAKPNAKKASIYSFEFGVNLAPAAGLEAIKENRSNFINRSYFSSIAGSSSSGSGFNNGIHAQLNIGKHWFIRQGIYSTNYAATHNYDYTITELPHATENIGIEYYLLLNPSEYRDIRYNGKSSIKYVSIPLLLGNRAFINKRCGIESKIGFNVSRLWNAQGQVVNPTFLNLEAINSNNSIKKWNTGMSISTGWFYKPNNNLIFTVEPNFSMLLSSAKVKDYPVKTSYYNYGININLNYVIGGSKK